MIAVAGCHKLPYAQVVFRDQKGVNIIGNILSFSPASTVGTCILSISDVAMR